MTFPCLVLAGGFACVCYGLLAVIPMDILVVTVDDALRDLGGIYTEFVAVVVLGL